MIDETVKKQSIGERLLALRNQNNLTQEELAERLMVSRQSVSKWELNKALPDVDKLLLLSELYGFSIDYLVKGEEISKQNIKEAEILTECTEVLPETSAQSKDKETLVKRNILFTCMLFCSLFFVCILLFVVRLCAQHTFHMEEKNQDYASVDHIYEQYTKAEISIVNEDGNFIKKVVWLDIPRVREDDYIVSYYDTGRPDCIFLDYHSKTIVIPMIVGIIFLIFSIVFWMAWTDTREEGSIKHGRKEKQ